MIPNFLVGAVIPNLFFWGGKKINDHSVLLPPNKKTTFQQDVFLFFSVLSVPNKQPNLDPAGEVAFFPTGSLDIRIDATGVGSRGFQPLRSMDILISPRISFGT